jgi:NADH-quinone oxidoreductase subunit B
MTLQTVPRFTWGCLLASPEYPGPVAAVDLPSPRAGRDTSAAAGMGTAAAGTVVLDTARGYALWVFDAGLACCAVECAAALSRVSGAAGADEAGPGDGSPGDGGPGDTGPGDERPGDAASGHRRANVFIVAGTVTDKLAPLVVRAYQRVPEPKSVLSFGACSNSGGPYWDSYCVTKGVDQIIPVDVYVPGCPPRPEALLHGLDVLAQQDPAAGHLAGRA